LKSSLTTLTAGIISLFSLSFSDQCGMFDILLWLQRSFVDMKSSLSADALLINYYNWIKLYEDAPLRVLIEMGVVLFLLWLCLIRKAVGSGRLSKDKQLSTSELDRLIEAWQPEALVNPATKTQDAIIKSMMVSFDDFYSKRSFF
jgi:hypothetical protein